MGVIATLIPNAAHLQRLRAAIRDRHELVPCESWTQLTTACAEQPVRVAVVDFYAHGRSRHEALRKLKYRFPRLTVIGYVGYESARVHDVFEAGRSGMDALIIADVDDSPRGLLAVVGQAEARSLGAAVRRSLESVDPSVREAVLLAVTRAHERITPTQFAELLALHRRTLGKRLAAAGFPPPQRLITWGRLIVAAHMLEEANRSANSIASALDFPSGSAFRNTCQRYLHATPENIRSRGGATYAVKALLRSVSDSQQIRTVPATTINGSPAVAGHLMKNVMRKYHLVLLTLAAAGACSNDAPTGPSTASAPANHAYAWKTPTAIVTGKLEPLNCVPKQTFEGSAVIGPNGGVLRVGSHKLIIPSGALGEEVRISGTVPEGRPFEIDLQPHGLQFKKAAGLVLDTSSCTDVPTIIYVVDQVEVGDPIPARWSPWWKAYACPIWHFSGYMIALGDNTASNEISTH